MMKKVFRISKDRLKKEQSPDQNEISNFVRIHLDGSDAAMIQKVGNLV